MLQEKAIDNTLIDLIKSLQAKTYLEGFCLAGGTALAFFLNHRKSADIGLFSDFHFSTADMLDSVRHDYAFQLLHSAENTLRGFIGDIKVDILAHCYDIVAPNVIYESIRMLSVPDIIAMKLNDICLSGQRSKDFIDIYYLLELYTISQMLEFYRLKYRQENLSNVIKSLIYFNDVDLSDWPVIVKDPGLRWAAVRKRIEQEVMSSVRKKY